MPNLEEVERRLKLRLPPEDAKYAHDWYRAYREDTAPINASYSKAASPTVAERERKIAQSDSLYAQRVSETKSELASAQRRAKAALYDARVRRDAELRTWARECDGILAPLKVDRAARLKPFAEKRERAAKLYREIWNEIEREEKETGK
jgi:hypothetical protein